MSTSTTRGESAFQIRRHYLVDQVISALRGQIAEGKYEDGDRLPSEADLGRHFNVGRSTVREALRVLAHLGVVETWTGKGSFVRRKAEITNGGDAMSIEDIANIYRLRFVIEGDAVEIAARKRSETDIDRIRVARQRLQDAVDTGILEEAVKSDFDLHYSILAAAHNGFALRIYTEHRDEMVRATLALLRLARPAIGGSQDSPAAIHDDLIKAIVAQDSVAARRAVSRDAREFEILLRLLERENSIALPEQEGV